MLRLRLKKIGKKLQPIYQLVIADSKTKRNGKDIEKVGYYNPLKKIFKINETSIKQWVIKGAKPTKTVNNLLKKYKLFLNS
uniref:Ribosomal protein S16 n=1 Tax=Nitzschia sp. (in: diatoms) TaxID=1884248 RepID=A0A5J6DUJ9_9STRA|nr:ribosomal protein S16 [Nitzschia sp. (in: diatoms)]